MAVGFVLRVGHALHAGRQAEMLRSRRTSVLCIAAVAALLIDIPAAGKQSPASWKVKVEATELDRRMLLDKLNEHGAEHGLRFDLADSDYDYRIVFSTGQHAVPLFVGGSGGDMNASMA